MLFLLTVNNILLFFSFLLTCNNKWGVFLLTFYNRYIKLCAEFRKAPSAIAEEVGLSRTSPNGWKKGKQPSQVNLQKLADYFDVSVEYLKGETDIKKAPSSEEDEAAAEFTRLFETLTMEQREFVLAAMRGMNKE